MNAFLREKLKTFICDENYFINKNKFFVIKFERNEEFQCFRACGQTKPEDTTSRELRNCQ